MNKKYKSPSIDFIKFRISNCVNTDGSNINTLKQYGIKTYDINYDKLKS
ncbi:MAG: hypothetical protein Q4D26_09325 [Clostridia bacterium]|nr:hypothetical protein [Clostridia bacterium]